MRPGRRGIDREGIGRERAGRISGPGFSDYLLARVPINAPIGRSDRVPRSVIESAAVFEAVETQSDCNRIECSLPG